MIKLNLDIMNGIIYKIIFFFLLLLNLSCNKEKKIKQEENKKIINTFKIDDIDLIKYKDTLFLDSEKKQLGESWYKKYKDKFNKYLIQKTHFDDETSIRFKKFKYSKIESLPYLLIQKRIDINYNFKTVIATDPEYAYYIFNYNMDNELIDFVDLSAYNDLYCQCNSTLFIDNKGVITGIIESIDSPNYKFEQLKINDSGKFELVGKYISKNLKDVSINNKLQFIIDKTEVANSDLKLLPFDDSFSNSIFIKPDLVKKIFFSKSTNFTKYNDLLSKEYFNQINERGIYIYKKIKINDKNILITYLDMLDDSCILFVFNNNLVVTDILPIHIINSDEILLEKHKNEISISSLKFEDIPDYTLNKVGKFVFK